MFPIRDHNPSERTPYVTYALLAANIVIFALYSPMLADQQALGAFFDQWALFPAKVTNGYGYGGILTSMFLHGGLMHLAGNMLFLWIYGDNMEDEMGHFGFLAFYLLAGIAAGIAQIAADPASQIPMVGASGAIAGVMGGYLLLFPKARIDIFIFFVVIVRVIPIPAWIVLGLWFAMQIFSGVGVPSDQGGVAYWAHAGGFIAGIAMTIPVWMRRGGVRFWDRTDGHPQHPEATYDYIRSRIPKVTRK